MYLVIVLWFLFSIFLCIRSFYRQSSWNRLLILFSPPFYCGVGYTPSRVNSSLLGQIKTFFFILCLYEYFWDLLLDFGCFGIFNCSDCKLFNEYKMGFQQYNIENMVLEFNLFIVISIIGLVINEIVLYIFIDLVCINHLIFIDYIGRNNMVLEFYCMKNFILWKRIYLDY